MMGFGSYGYGGSSPASNLSALAPPFTVDRSAPKISPNPIGDFNVDLPYAMAVPLNSSLHNWVPPHYPTSRPDLFANPNTDDVSIHGSSGYNYPASQPISSCSSTSLPSVNPVAIATTGAFSCELCPEGVPINLVEAKPYYPSLVSQAIHNDSPLDLPHQAGYDLLSSSYASALNGSSHDECTESLTGLEYTPQWSGVWNGLADWNGDKHVEIDENFYSRETPNVAAPSNYSNYLNQGTNASRGLSTFEGLPCDNDMIIQEKGDGSVSRNLFEDKSYSGKNSNFVPIGYSNTSFLGSAVLPGTHTKEPFVEYVVNPTEHKLPYGSYDEVFVQHDIGMNLATSDAFTAPASSLPSVGTNYLAPNTSPLKDVNVTKDVGNMNFVGNNSSGTKEGHFLQTSDAKGHFDASLIGIDLNRDDNFLAGTSTAKYNELSMNINASNNTLDMIFKANSELQVPQERTDLFSVPPDLNEPFASAEFSETLDHYNTAVDSPCWKGVPFSRFSPFTGSDADTPQQLKKEACYGLNLHSPQGFSLGDVARVSSQVQGENTFFHGSGYVKNGLVPPAKKPSVDHAMEAGFCHSKLIHEPRKDYTLPCKLVGDSDFKPFHTAQQLPGGGKMVSETNVKSGSNVADSGMNINDTLEDISPDGPFRAAESMLRSPPSSENVSSKPLNLPEGQPTSKTDVKVLIKTMCNLSEMFLIHCSNDSCIVKEKDVETLKYVINNLETCLRKNLQPKPPVQESVLSQGDTCQFDGQLPDLHKETKHHIMLTKKEEKVSEIDLPRVVEDYINDDKMTQSIKKVLNENFDEEEETDPQVLLYKNLWLEAEAAICSINYKARFNRMKIEMEKNKLLKAKDNAMDFKKLPNYKVSPVLSAVNNDLTSEANSPAAAVPVCDSSMISTNGHPDDVTARLRVLKCRFGISNSANAVNEQDSSNSQVSPNLNNGELFANKPRDNLSSDVSIPDSPIVSTNSHSDDVMSRYHILKFRVDGSNTMDTTDERGIWDSGDASDLRKVEKLGTEVKGGQTPNISILDSSAISSRAIELNFIETLGSEGKSTDIPDISFQDSPIVSRVSLAGDVEPSILARFHILKSRADNSSSLDMEREQVVDADLGFASKKDYWSITSNGLWEGKLNANLKSALQHDTANYCDDKSSGVSHRPGNQLPAGWHDNSSSDWEHVLKEDLPGHN